MNSFLNRPYPYSEDPVRKIVISVGISFFVFGFLYIFKPFGMGLIEVNELVIAAGYGGVTLAVTLISGFLLPVLFSSVFKEEGWTIGKEIIYTLFVISLVAFGNLIYTSFMGFIKLSLYAFLDFELITLTVAVLPLTLLIFIKQNILLRRNLRVTRELSNNLYHKERMTVKAGVKIIIASENSKDNLAMEANELYCIAAADNYVEVYYLSENKPVKKLMRTTMRSVQSNLKPYSQFYRCHRAYIINLEKVKEVTGNAQGYKLILENFDILVPVARSMNKEINLRLRR